MIKIAFYTKKINEKQMSYDYASLKKEKLEEQQAIEEINKQLPKNVL